MKWKSIKLAALGLLMPALLSAQHGGEHDHDKDKARFRGMMSFSTVTQGVFMPGFFIGPNGGLESRAMLHYQDDLDLMVQDFTNYDQGTFRRNYGVRWHILPTAKHWKPTFTWVYADYANGKIPQGYNTMGIIGVTHTSRAGDFSVSWQKILDRPESGLVDLGTNNAFHFFASRPFVRKLNEEKKQSLTFTPEVRSTYNNEFMELPHAPMGSEFTHVTPGLNLTYMHGPWMLSGEVNRQIRLVDNTFMNRFTGPDKPSLFYAGVGIERHFTIK